MTTRRAWRVLRGAAYTAVIAAIVLCSPQQMVAADAGSVEVCVTMSGGDSQVGGLQMDLSWDAGCMTAQQRARGRPRSALRIAPPARASRRPTRRHL